MEIPKELIDWSIRMTFPPDVTEFPAHIVVHDGSYDGPIQLFTEALWNAMYQIERCGDNGLLDAMRKKWPDGVAKHYEQVKERFDDKFMIVVKAEERSGTFTDERDGQTYRTVKMPGGKIWMAQNLNYRPKSGNSWCYNDDESMGDKYGRLYDWETAMKVAPAGWHLPSDYEWNNLGETISGLKNLACKRLKSTSGWNENCNGTDDFGFTALPGGIRLSDGEFRDVGNHCSWWTDTEDVDDRDYSACACDIYYDYDGLCMGNDYKSEGHSVRYIVD